MISIRNLTILLAVILPIVATDSFAATRLYPLTTKYSPIVYNEKSKSYFQYVLYPLAHNFGWHEAQNLAEKMTYKNVGGRLAVVTDREVSNFLRKTFKPELETWIGLRYYCKYKKLMWVTGHLLDRTGFQDWAPRWIRNPKVNCDKIMEDYIDLPYMPVYYLPVSQGFRWQASGPAKYFNGYFVEFVTGEE